MRRNRLVDLGWLLGITSLGLILRLVGLDWESIWYDEAVSLKMAAVPVGELISGEIIERGNPCGYHILLRLWCLTFGFSIVSARAFSAVCGTGAVLFAWPLARAAGASRLVAGTACLLTALNPALVFLGREARVFALQATVVTLVAWLASRVARRGGIGAWVGLAVCCALMIHLQYNAFWVLAILPFPILWSRRDHFWPTLAKITVLYVAVGLAFLPWLGHFQAQFVEVCGAGHRSPRSSWTHAVYFPVFSVAGRTFVWKQHGLIMLLLAETVVVLGIFAPLLWQLRHRNWIPWLPVWMAVGVPFVAVGVSALLTPLFNGRYVSLIIPCLMVVLAAAMWQLLRSRMRFRWLPAVLLGAIMAISLTCLYALRQKDDWRGLARHVARRGPTQLVVLYQDIGGIPFAYYLPQHPQLLLLEHFSENGKSWDDAGYPAIMSKHEDFWVVLWLRGLQVDEKQIVDWLDQRFRRAEDRRFPRLRLLRYRGPAADSPDHPHQAIRAPAMKSPAPRLRYAAVRGEH